MTRHKHADLIHAWAEGAEIQTFYNGKWEYEPNPCFYPDKEYRIKPRTVKREGWINIWSINQARTYGVIGVGGNVFDSEELAKENMSGGATVKIEWEETI